MPSISGKQRLSSGFEKLFGHSTDRGSHEREIAANWEVGTFIRAFRLLTIPDGTPSDRTEMLRGNRPGRYSGARSGRFEEQAAYPAQVAAKT